MNFSKSFLKNSLVQINSKLNSKSYDYLYELIEENGYETRQTSKEQTNIFQDLCWKVHDPAQSFVLLSYTMHELRNQHFSIG